MPGGACVVRVRGGGGNGKTVTCSWQRQLSPWRGKGAGLVPAASFGLGCATRGRARFALGEWQHIHGKNHETFQTAWGKWPLALPMPTEGNCK